ncbi:hypothetical protein ACWDZ8_39975, partial [Streptomyces sp. NPDC003233]
HQLGPYRLAHPSKQARAGAKYSRSRRRVARTRGLIAEVEVRPVIRPGAHPDRRALARAAQPVAHEPAWTHAALVAGRPAHAAPVRTG